MKFTLVSAFLFVILVVVQGQLLGSQSNQVNQQGVNLLGGSDASQPEQDSSQDSTLLLVPNSQISQGGAGTGALPAPAQPQESTATGKGLPAGAGKPGAPVGKP